MLKIWYVTLFAAATSAIEVDDVVFKQLVDGVTTLEDKGAIFSVVLNNKNSDICSILMESFCVY